MENILRNDYKVVEIFINNEGKETKLTWDYKDRFPTEEEKKATRKLVRDENKKNRLNAEAEKLDKKLDKLI